MPKLTPSSIGPATTGRCAPPSPRRRPRATAVAALLLVGGVAPSACSGSGFTYIKSTSNNTYFKVPNDWKVYDRDAVLEASDSPSDQDASALRFIAIFDADPNPSIEHELSTATHPFGLARVRELGVEERDVFSLSKLRNEIVPIDEILEKDVGKVELVESPRSVVKGGLAGTRLVYTVRTEDGSFTVHQTGLVDAETRLVYFFIVGCQTTCFSAHRDTINEIADSWTIKES